MPDPFLCMWVGLLGPTYTKASGQDAPPTSDPNGFFGVDLD